MEISAQGSEFGTARGLDVGWCNEKYCLLHVPRRHCDVYIDSTLPSNTSEHW